MVLAGGGLNNGRAIGVTNEIGEEIAERNTPAVFTGHEIDTGIEDQQGRRGVGGR